MPFDSIFLLASLPLFDHYPRPLLFHVSDFNEIDM